MYGRVERMTFEEKRRMMIPYGTKVADGKLIVEINAHDVDKDYYLHAIRTAGGSEEFIMRMFNENRLLAIRPKEEVDAPNIVDVIFNDPATIVLWSDGTKTVVKASDEPYDKEKGLAMAIAKKSMGNTSKYYKLIRHFTEGK